MAYRSRNRTSTRSLQKLLHLLYLFSSLFSSSHDTTVLLRWAPNLPLVLPAAVTLGNHSCGRWQAPFAQRLNSWPARTRLSFPLHFDPSTVPSFVLAKNTRSLAIPFSSSSHQLWHSLRPCLRIALPASYLHASCIVTSSHTAPTSHT